MKRRLLFLLLLCSLTAFCALAEDSLVYEAEKAALGDGLRSISDAACSGWKAVGTFETAGDALTFTVTVPKGGLYDLTLRTKGIGGVKTNDLLVDGQQAATFDSPAFVYGDTTVKGVQLSQGEHSITISASWGYIYVDKLTLSAADGIDPAVYDVSPTLVNPNATDNAKKLFSWLCDIYGKYTLSGQVCDGGIGGQEIQAIYQLTGKYPAILGLDMMDHTPSRLAIGGRGTAVNQAIAWHNEGGIVTFCWHWSAAKQYIKSGKDANGNPRWWGGFYTDNVTFDIEAVMNGSDPEGKAALDKDIEGIAQQLLKLQDAGVPVLWRPLHEASGGWFWWGAKGAEPCKQLWIHLYDQLTNVYGCNNLIWVWNGQDKAWYPGDEYVDVIGEDIYAAAHSYGAQNAKFTELLDYTATNKIIALTENGVLFDIDNVVSTNARWAWFCTWSGEFVLKDGRYSQAYTEAATLIKTYQSQYVLTLDELPYPFY